MQKEQLKNELIISGAFIVLLILFLNPFHFWMPNAVTYMMLAGLFVVFAVFASFLWKERAQDEREEAHRQIAGRVGYIAGIGTLVLAIAVESIVSHPDPWLIIVLGVMVLGKMAGLLYAKMCN